jgi:hypothetical protein
MKWLNYSIMASGMALGMTKVTEAVSYITPFFSNLTLVATVFTTTFVLIVDGADDFIRKVKHGGVRNE